MSRSVSDASLRVAVVVQRYGLEINGGAELHARQIVERLQTQHQVEVLTSCALDYTVWDMHYAPGEDRVAGVRVRRFAHPQRGHDGRARIPKPHKLRRSAAKLIPDSLRWPRVAHPRGDAAWDGLDYLRRQGPFCEGLVQHLRDHGDEYDVVIFFTALYYPTAVGIGATRTPTILVPTLHDEAAMYLPAFHDVFRAPRWVLWNTEAEYATARRLYGDDIAPGEVCGVGIDVVETSVESVAAARSRNGVRGPYLVFVGRVAAAKGFDVLLEAFTAHRQRHGGELSLVVVGQVFEDSPQATGVQYTGFIDTDDKNALIAGALGCVVSSRHESLSLVLLESFKLGTPVIANAESDVLREHVERSGAGIAYRGARGLQEAIRRLLALTPAERATMSGAGRRYVEQTYTWARVLPKIAAALARVTGPAR